MRLFATILRTAGLLAIAYAQTRNEYDYIICGGGTAGLAVANKLSEQTDVTVLVVEAGELDSASSWDYQSAPQTYVDDRVLTLPAGRAVGGSSQINGKAYIRPERSSIDDWGTANNADWSWDTLFPFYRASEGLDIPDANQESLGASINPEFHGTNGSVKLSFPAVGSAEFYDVLVDTFENFTIPKILDVNGGSARGVCTWPGEYTIAGQREQIRAGSKENYYVPVQDRSNLELLTGTTCLRLVWGDGNSGDRSSTASGVEIANANNQTTVSVNKEVILSAGSYRSPVILEYSGIGNPDILARYGIKSVVDLPGVGENLQDQMVGSLTYTRSNRSAEVVFPTTVGEEITTNYIAHLTHEDVFGDIAGEIQSRVESSLADYASVMSDRINSSLSADQILKSLEIQYNAIFVDGVPAVEVLSRMAQNNNEINIEFWPLIALNRGNVHISGSNAEIAESAPIIDSNWGQTDYDWDIYIAAAKFVRKLFATPPLSDLVDKETNPSFASVPIDASDEEWKSFWMGRFRAGWHPVGSAAMLPREWGGVVDGDLKVYGTGNVRVVDASVVPFNLGGHPTSTVYALAERAAWLILSGESG